jgi:hypothetical protein
MSKKLRHTSPAIFPFLLTFLFQDSIMTVPSSESTDAPVDFKSLDFLPDYYLTQSETGVGKMKRMILNEPAVPLGVSNLPFIVRKRIHLAIRLITWCC